MRGPRQPLKYPAPAPALPNNKHLPSSSSNSGDRDPLSGLATGVEALLQPQAQPPGPAKASDAAGAAAAACGTAAEDELRMVVIDDSPGPARLVRLHTRNSKACRQASCMLL